MLEDPAKGAWGDKLRLQLAPGGPMASPLVRLSLVAKDADADRTLTRTLALIRTLNAASLSLTVTPTRTQP